MASIDSSKRRFYLMSEVRPASCVKSLALSRAQSHGHAPESGRIRATVQKNLFFRGDDFAAIVVTAGRTDMMRPLQLTAIGTFSMGFGGDRVMRTAHIAFRR